MGENEENSPEIHNITVEKIGEDRFRVLLGTQTEIPGLFSAFTGIELDRALIEEFIESAQNALKR
ncbi:MAG: hypothetical protein V3S04_01010 [Candidatus Omnitrophota bacterium]